MSHGPVGSDDPPIYEDSGEKCGGGRVVLIAAVAAMGGLLFGYDSAVINGAVGAVQDQWQVSNLALGVAVAAALLGAAIGALLAGRLADRIGRLSVMRLAAVLFFASAIGTAFSPEIVTLGVFRVVGGLGVGVASVIAPAYIAETSPPHIRGRLGSLQQLAIVTGIFVSLAVDALLAHLAGGAGEELWWGMPAWRWMFLMMAVPAVVYGGLSFTIPESPRYLIAKFRIPEARKVLTMLLGEKNLELTISRIQESLASDKPPSWRDLRKPTGGLYGIVWVGVGLSVFQQFVGINVIFYYSIVLWQAVGFDESQSFTITVITSIVNIATTLIAIALIDKIGRKPLLLVGSAGMTLSLSTMAIIFGFFAETGADGHVSLPVAAGTVALVAANLFVVAFGMSWGPVVWVLLGEMFPNRIRAAALGLAASAQWVANAIITTTFPGLRDVLGGAYGFYAICAAASLVFVWKFVHETKGKNLEDMHAELMKD